MNWEKNSVLLLLLATAAILVGTIITMVLPFAWINTEADRIETVKPYTPLEQEGRDVYIREGCNNCHTQTVRPLVAEVQRYGDYSKSGEFVYDRPHLWGSRRTGPDLARVGGKYPDEWHTEHFNNPKAMVPKSNMPSYAFLNKNTIDPAYTQKKMDVLGFPYTADQIKALEGKTEMDAMVAYMQKLGSDIDWRKDVKAEIVGELKNPFPGDAAAIAAGKTIYDRNCAACHGKQLEGTIGPALAAQGLPEDYLYEAIHNGVTDNGMPAFSQLGSDKIWKMVNYILSFEEE